MFFHKFLLTTEFLPAKFQFAALSSTVQVGKDPDTVWLVVASKTSSVEELSRMDSTKLFRVG